MPKMFFWLSALLMLLSQATASSVPWGRYTVTVSPMTGPDAHGTQVTLREGRHVLTTVHDQMLNATLVPLRPGGQPELVLTGFSGGPQCCTTYTIFSQDTGTLERLGVLDGGPYGATFQDLDHDGTQEIVYRSPALVGFDFGYASSPGLDTVIGWNGRQLADQTHRYFNVPWKASRVYQQELLSSTPPEMLRGALSGYYGNMVLAGQGVAAEAYLKTTVFPEKPFLAKWFTQHRRALLNALSTVPEASLRHLNSESFSFLH